MDLFQALVSALSGQWRDEADRGGEAGNHESLSLNTMKESPVAIISLHHYVSWPGQRHGMTGLVASGGRWGWAYTPIIS